MGIKILMGMALALSAAPAAAADRPIGLDSWDIFSLLLLDTRVTRDETPALPQPTGPIDASRPARSIGTVPDLAAFDRLAPVYFSMASPAAGMSVAVGWPRRADPEVGVHDTARSVMAMGSLDLGRDMVPHRGSPFDTMLVVRFDGRSAMPRLDITGRLGALLWTGGKIGMGWRPAEIHTAH